MRYNNNYYDRPNPHSIGDTGRMYRDQKKEFKEDFKREELNTELKDENREKEKK